MTQAPFTVALDLPLKPFADLSVSVGAPIEVGVTPTGRRRVIPITGGEARGDGWTARVLPGGADYQRVLSETRAELQAHYVLELDGGDLVYVHNHAIRVAPAAVTAALLRGETVDAAQVYFRCFPCLETASPALRWINDRLFAGAGVRHPERVAMSFHELA
ncbi:MAG: DUF3237 domain-containing protein [Comamonadaceae bacterium]|nr:MAG: DUF3237 domain-containing protein [Comamonadaceae bacterium]